MDPLLLLTGLAIAGSTALAVVFTYQWITVPQRAARARVMPRRAEGMGMRTALRALPQASSTLDTYLKSQIGHPGYATIIR